MNEMITITKEEYDRLREAAEDLADLQAYDRAVAEGGESYPSDVVNRIIDGESPIRVLREYRGMTQQQLANAAGITRVMVTHIESKRRIGSIETLKAVANALGVDLDMIV